jgi:peptidylprolyl isomerase
VEHAQRGDRVKVHYTGKLDDGTVFDTSEGRDPLEFQLGATYEIIKGFHDGVIGMTVGDSRTVNVPVDDAYGPRDEKLVAVIDRERFPAEMQPEIGQRLQLVQTDDRKIFATVMAISESGVTIDANHFLAGKDLTFDIELVAIL